MYRPVRQAIQQLSIKAKLILLATTSVALALVLAFAGLATNDIGFIRMSKVEQLESQAKMLAFNCTGVLVFQDADATRELLSSMVMYPSVDFACVHDERGQVFATYKSNESVVTPAAPLHEVGHRFDGDCVEIFRPVKDHGETIGSIYLRANMSDLQAHIRRYLLIGSTIMLGSLIGAGLFSLWMQQSISQPVQQLAKAAQAIKSNRDYSIRVQPSSDDELGQLCVTFNAMLDEIQTSKAALQTAHDELESRVEQRTEQLTQEIEQRQAIQEALEASRDEAQAANRAKSEFLANMSHEIRTPLNGILGFTELLSSNLHDDDPGTRQEHLDTITTSGNHLLVLINDILDLSKIEAGQLELELSPCSPHELITQVVSVLRARAQQKGLKLNCNWSSKVPESIVTDGTRLRQLLMNLVGNAIKFTDEGAVSINAELDAFNELLTVRIVDTGIGIPKDKQEAIFSPFVQADNSLTRRYGGTGLGLAICQRISDTLGGELSVASTIGKGSEFVLKIQTGSLKEVSLLEAPSADALQSMVCQSEDSAIVDLTSAHILLVEDGVINRKLVKHMLERAGAKVATAENGWVGVQLAQQEACDLIIMDMQMPVMDGYTAATKLRELGFSTPILALTAHAMKGDEKKCLDAGCTAYLTKPVQSQTLLTTVSKYLGSAEERANSSVPNNANAERSTATGLVSTLPLENQVYREIVEEFVEFLSDTIDAMQAAYEGGKLETLAQLAHGLKGAGGTAGFDVLTAPSAALQASATEESSEGIESSLVELSELTHRIQETPQLAHGFTAP